MLAIVGDVFRAIHLTDDTRRQPLSGTLCHGHPTLQVGQLKIGRAVAAVEGAQQGEQCLVLRDAQDLSVAQGPATGGEVEGERLNRTHKDFHGSSSFCYVVWRAAR
jgi:hypothetical protein